MPGRKGKKTTTTQNNQEPNDPQEDAFERLSDRLTATFAQGFDKLQQAIVTMAEQSASRPEPPPQPKRPAEDTAVGYNSRNKNLRPLYNPPVDPPQKKTKKQPAKPQKPSAAAGRPADAIDVTQPDVPTPAATAQTTSVGHCSNVNIPSRPGPSDTALAMNDWIIGQATTNKPPAQPSFLPLSVSQIPNDPSLEAQVHQVLLNTASSLAKGNQNNPLYPHRYVVRGPEQKKMGLNSLTILEYLHGILRMIKDQTVSSSIKPYLYAHLEEIIEDARQYDWATAVRPWSEEIFTLVAEGRLLGIASKYTNVTYDYITSQYSSYLQPTNSPTAKSI